MQTKFPFLAVMQAPKRAPDGMVARIESEAQAVAVSLQSSHCKQAYIAAQLGISPTYLSLIRHGERPLPGRLVVPLCYLTGTWLIQQHRDFREALAVVQGRTDCIVAAMANELRRVAA
jgi:hypothetical protein